MRRCLLALALALVAALAACGRDVLPPLARPEADVRLLLEEADVTAGEPVRVRLEVSTAEGVEIQVPEPAAEGLEARLVDERVETLEGRTVRTLEYALTGEAGSYVVLAGPATARHPDGREEQLELAPLFVDLGVEGPSSALEGLLAPTPPEAPAWPWWVAGGVLLLAALGVLAWILVRRRGRGVVAPPDPPWVVAEQAWDRVMGDPSLDDHGRALGLSEVFRTYLEARFAFPATARTTREIREVLYRDGLPATLLDRAVRLLTATDLLKFARQGGGEAFFASLDEDFRACLAATRPTGTPAGEAAHA